MVFKLMINVTEFCTSDMFRYSSTRSGHDRQLFVLYSRIEKSQKSLFPDIPVIVKNQFKKMCPWGAWDPYLPVRLKGHMKIYTVGNVL